MNAVDYVERCGEPAVAVTPPDEVTAWNPAMEALTGIAPRDAMGRSFTALLAPHDVFGNPLAWPTRGLRELLEGAEPLWPFEVDLASGGGDRVRVRCGSVVFVSPAGVLNAAHVFWRVLQRRRADLVLDWLLRHTDEAPLSLAAEVRHVRSDRPNGKDSGLTSRQSEILRLLARGLVAKEIAAELAISVHTVRAHLQAILRKLKVHSQREAVIAAYRNGWI